MTTDEELFDEVCDSIAEDMCRQCPRAIQCHEDCTYCDDIYDAAMEMYPDIFVNIGY